MGIYEYTSVTELDKISGNYFVVPASIILDTNQNNKRVSIFSYFSIKRGLDCTVTFTINSLLKWFNKKSDKHVNGINDKIVQIIEYLSHGGYLILSDKPSSYTTSSMIDAEYNLSKISQECEHDRFAVIYIDELKKILNYKSSNPKDTFLNVDVILLVFAYLRMMIYRRRNKLMPEEINIDNKNDYSLDIKSRKIRSPDAYDCYYYEIAENLDISARVISKVVAILNELDLIYSEPLPRIKYNNQWRTDHTVFCNTYKRESNYLLTSGKEYYLEEVENKKKKLNIINLDGNDD